MRFVRSVLLMPVVLTFVAASARAQQKPPRHEQPAALPTAPVEIPPPPTVDDPMLAPMPPAPRNVANWEEALSLVRARSTDLRIAYLEIQRAEAQTRIALAGALPSLNGTAIATHNFITNDISTFVGGTAAAPQIRSTTSPLGNFATGSVQLIQPLFNLRAWDAIGIAKENQKVSQLSMDDIKRNIALSVANALVGAVTAERIAELNRVAFRNALERLDLAQRKKRLGASTGLDVVRAQQDVETTRATLVTGDEALRQAREALGLGLGIPSQVGVSRDLNIDGLEKDAMSSCRVAPSVDARSDVAAARQRVEVARRNVDNVYLQFVPTVNGQSTVNTTTADTFASPNTTWNIQGVLTVPFFEGGARYGQLRDTRAQQGEAEQNLEALRRTATVQVEQARRGVSVAAASRKVASDARALAAETDRLVRTGYIEGQGTSLELVIAATALRQADITLALREFDLVKARVLAILALATCPW